MTVIYHPDAASDLIAAARYYRDIDVDLGEALLASVEAAAARLARSPLIGQADAHDRRRWWIRRFPYLIIYRVRDETVVILAIAHTSRPPGYWQPRDRPAPQTKT